MGSFNKTCGISGMTIGGGEECYVTRLERQKHVYRNGANIFKVDQEWQPISFPQLTTYYDYGQIDEEFEPNAINKILGLEAVDTAENDETIVDKDEDGTEYGLRDTLFLVHKKVYEKFSSEIISPDLFHYRAAIVEQGPSYFIKAFDDAKEMTSPERKFMFHVHVEASHAFGWTNSKIGWNLFDQIYDNDSYDILDKAVEAGLADELHRQFIFEENMQEMWKHYRPSNYASQDDNRDSYIVLADLIKEIASDKQEAWDSY